MCRARRAAALPGELDAAARGKARLAALPCAIARELARESAVTARCDALRTRSMRASSSPALGRSARAARARDAGRQRRGVRLHAASRCERWRRAAAPLRASRDALRWCGAAWPRVPRLGTRTCTRCWGGCMPRAGCARQLSSITRSSGCCRSARSRAIEAAVELLLRAPQHGRVLVIGDFDADGATSSALVVRALRAAASQRWTSWCRTASSSATGSRRRSWRWRAALADTHRHRRQWHLEPRRRRLPRARSASTC